MCVQSRVPNYPCCESTWTIWHRNKQIFYYPKPVVIIQHPLRYWWPQNKSQAVPNVWVAKSPETVDVLPGVCQGFIASFRQERCGACHPKLWMACRRMGANWYYLWRHWYWLTRHQHCFSQNKCYKALWMCYVVTGEEQRPHKTSF